MASTARLPCRPCISHPACLLSFFSVSCVCVCVCVCACSPCLPCVLCVEFPVHSALCVCVCMRVLRNACLDGPSTHSHQSTSDGSFLLPLLLMFWRYPPYLAYPARARRACECESHLTPTCAFLKPSYDSRARKRRLDRQTAKIRHMYHQSLHARRALRPRHASAAVLPLPTCLPRLQGRDLCTTFRLILIPSPHSQTSTSRHHRHCFPPRLLQHRVQGSQAAAFAPTRAHVETAVRSATPAAPCEHLLSVLWRPKGGCARGAASGHTQQALHHTRHGSSFLANPPHLHTRWSSQSMQHTQTALWVGSGDGGSAAPLSYVAVMHTAVMVTHPHCRC
jgi:hypothetical protein